MKIVHSSDTRLVLEDRPRFMAGFLWFMGALCLFSSLTGRTDGIAETLLVLSLGIGLCIFAHCFFPFQRLRFDRTEGQMTRTIARITGRKVSTLPLSDIERAMVQAQWSDGARLERLALVVKGEHHPMEPGYSSIARDPLVAEINAWLAGENT